MIHDITPANTQWAKNYAHMEYMRIVDHDLWNPTRYIEVKYKSEPLVIAGIDFAPAIDQLNNLTIRSYK